ncbi:putative cytochrome P450 [Helianthus annuus]|nr:putative cytochrome P450 [Helianthus annuus]
MLLSFELLMSPLISFPLLLLLLIPFKWLLSSAVKAPKNLPPSPPKLPIIGNLHQLGSIPHLSLRTLAEKYGPVMMLHLGSVQMLVVTSAKAAQEILKTHDLVFSNRPKLEIPDQLNYGSKDIGFAPYGEYWRQIKSISIIHLLSKKQVQSFRQVRERETARLIDLIGQSGGSVVNVTNMLVKLTNNVICEVALGRTYNDGFKFKDMLVKFQTLLGAVGVGTYIPWLSWVDSLRGLNRQTKKLAKELNDFYDAIIEEHVVKRKMGGAGDNQEPDLVDILLDVQKDSATTGFTFGRDTIKAIISDVFSGGTDTTSSSIEWALSELIKTPPAMKRLQQELTDVAKGRSMITEDDIDNMPYLKAVLKETLRLHTPLPLLVPHESMDDVSVFGYDLKKGTQVMVNCWAIARDPSIWEDADMFKPERFLNSCVDFKGFHYELLPFGSGRRGCPGIQFAVSINELVLANLVYKYEFALPNGVGGEELDMAELVGLVVRKKDPLMLVPTARF